MRQDTEAHVSAETACLSDGPRDNGRKEKRTYMLLKLAWRHCCCCCCCCCVNQLLGAQLLERPRLCLAAVPLHLQKTCTSTSVIRHEHCVWQPSPHSPMEPRGVAGQGGGVVLCEQSTTCSACSAKENLHSCRTNDPKPSKGKFKGSTHLTANTTMQAAEILTRNPLCHQPYSHSSSVI